MSDISDRYQLDTPGFEGSQIPNLADIYQDHFGYKTDGAFVEVGAFDGGNWSNTHGLALLGWRGLLFEPQPEYYGKCYALYGKNPKVMVRPYAIGRRNMSIPLYLGGSLTTTKKDVIAVYNDLGWSRIAGLDEANSIYVKCYTLDYMLMDSAWQPGFDLLVVDVEGAEVDVLSGFSIGHWQPQLVIIEAHEQYPDVRLSAKAKPINRYFKRNGYRKIYSDTINSIFVKDVT